MLNPDDHDDPDEAAKEEAAENFDQVEEIYRELAELRAETEGEVTS